jgi:serine phosphatase RsbU (regulator of sigma subunit)
LLAGIFAALAYMAWDSIARKQRHIQLPIIDAIWQGKLFYKETGKAIIYGYAASGALLGVFAVALLGFDLSFFQFDSQFGFAEATSIIPVITIPLNALGIAVLGLIAHFGLSTSVVYEWFKKPAIAIPINFVFSGFLLTGVGRFFGTEGTYLQDFLIFSMLLVPLTLAYRQLGYLTVTVAWGSFAMILFMSSYFNPGSSSIIIQFLILLGVYLLPLIFGFIAARFGDSIVDERSYIPEYEEKISRQLRFEKEIEIARESQFELLPVNTPDLPEAMICGFFIPSFEVGGDYYDYFLKYDEAGNPKSLAITVVDVSGKAMKAAMHAVHTSGLILSRFPTDTPEQVLTMINPFIHQKTDKKTFITGIAAEYHFDTKLLRVANAGHCLPVLKRNGKAEFIETPAPKFPLGIIRKVNYNAIDVQLQSGDIVLFYSDGLPEAQNTRKQRFGFENVLKLMENMDLESDTSSGICQYIKRKVQTFSAYQMADDTTIVALKIN